MRQLALSRTRREVVAPERHLPGFEPKDGANLATDTLEVSKSGAYILYLSMSPANQPGGPRKGRELASRRRSSEVVSAAELGGRIVELCLYPGLHQVQAYSEGRRGAVGERTGVGIYVGNKPDGFHSDVAGGRDKRAGARISIRRPNMENPSVEVMVAADAIASMRGALNELLQLMCDSSNSWSITGALAVNPPDVTDQGYYDPPRPEPDPPRLEDNSACADCVIVRSYDSSLLDTANVPVYESL